MTTVLAIDPGSAGPGCACAAFEDGALSGAWFQHPGADGPGWGPFGVVVVERPAYQGERSLSARPIDLINLAWAGAMVAGMYLGRDVAELVELTPNDTVDRRCARHSIGRRTRNDPRRARLDDCTCTRGWKGSQPKPLMHARLWGELTVDESAILGGDATWKVIERTREKGALSRWAPGKSSYPRSFVTHNLLDAVCIGMAYTGRIVWR